LTFPIDYGILIGMNRLHIEPCQTVLTIPSSSRYPVEVTNNGALPLKIYAGIYEMTLYPQNSTVIDVKQAPESPVKPSKIQSKG
jgi:hypothetical protein